MNNLEELYRTLETLRKNNWPVPEEMLTAIDKSEREMIEERIVGAIREVVSPIASSIHRPFRIVIEHIPDTPLSVKVEGEEEKGKKFSSSGTPEPTPVASDVVAEKEPVNKTPSAKIIRKKSVGFKVTFPDGTVFQESQAVDTFILALQKIGLERIANDKTTPYHAGYRVVDRRERIADRVTQRFVDGFYVYINIGNDTKIEDLQAISQRFGIDLMVTIDESEDDIIGKKTVVNEEIQKKEQTIVSHFENYLIREGFAPATIRDYISTLNNAVSHYVTQIVDARASSIFDYTTEEDVLICIEMMKNSYRFMEDNTRKHNKMTASLSQYLQFVKLKG